MRNLGLTIVICCVLVWPGCSRQPKKARALPPQEALRSFQLSEDFTLELFASEPQVVDPVEMAFDENGRVYVAEMRDYPEDPPPGQPARSRIKVLEDTNGDGRIDGSDKAWIFADQVLQVSGLLPWNGGLLVTSAPDILFMKDSDGDGKADVKKVLFTGFPKVNPEGRITNLRYGLDNWIYAANNGADGKITSPERPDMPPLLVRGTDFRFRPDGGAAEQWSGPAQFGIALDEWGNEFITQNTVHIRHVVMPMNYLARAPLLGIPAVAQDISDHGRPSARMYQISDAQAWREARTRIRQHRHDDNRTGATEQLSGYFTGASGGTAYTGDAFPEEYKNNVFTGDVAGNLVHRDIIVPDGVSFSAKRSKDGVEFMATKDVWSRICAFANAPDGNLYMTDIYREFIETPESIPESIKKGMNFYSGDDLGRIYRLVPKNPRERRGLKPELGKAGTEQLVQALAHRNGWHRLTAQRLLVERQDRAAVPLLRQLAQSTDSPLARMHALWTLDGLRALEPNDVLPALKDAHAGVREHALRMAEPFVAKSRPVTDAVFALAADPQPRVQFQAALTLGNVKDPRALDTLANIGAQRGADRWFRMAVLSSTSNAPLALFERMQAKKVDWSKLGENSDFLAQIASLIAARHEVSEMSRFLQGIARVPQPEAALRGMTNGFKLAGVTGLKLPGGERLLLPFLNSSSDAVQKAAWETANYFELRELVQRAAGEALNDKLPLDRRALAVRALRGGSFEQARGTIEKLLDAAPPAELQVAAVDTLAFLENPQVPAVLLRYWRSLTPDARTHALDAMLNHTARIPVFLEALEKKQVDVAEVNPAARARLLENTDAAIAKRSQALFQAQTTDRARLVEQYRDVLAMNGDVSRGKEVFANKCARCHVQRRKGARVGPDLSGVNNKTKEELLTSILNPSYAIEARYTNYIVTTKDGRMHDGVIASETPAALVLRDGSDEGDDVILRKNIAEIRASRISLMPEDLEKGMSHQDLADLIAYMRAGL